MRERHQSIGCFRSFVRTQRDLCYSIPVPMAQWCMARRKDKQAHRSYEAPNRPTTFCTTYLSRKSTVGSICCCSIFDVQLATCSTPECIQVGQSVKTRRSSNELHRSRR